MNLIIFIALVAIVVLGMNRIMARQHLTLEQRVLRHSAAFGVLLLVVMGLTGRLHWLFALLGGGVAATMRLAPLLLRSGILRYLRGLSTKADKARPDSEIRSRFVRMTLEHATGEMTGDVLEGRFIGRALGTLDLQDLLALCGECQSASDNDSIQLLEAYLDRTHEGWREAHATHGDPASDGADPALGGTLTRTQAFAILGLDENATSEEIITAHRRLMQKVHPDRGGSTFLAATINKAKDVLVS
jgi:hypothetical protein